MSVGMVLEIAGCICFAFAAYPMPAPINVGYLGAFLFTLGILLGQGVVR